MEDVAKSLNVYEKAVPDLDEDTATIAVEAARNAILRAEIDPRRIGAIYTGSESHPYAVKPTGTIVGEALCCSHFHTVADMEFACKAGTAAIQACLGLVRSGMIDLGLAIGSDVSQGAPGDALEYTAAARWRSLCHWLQRSHRGDRGHILLHHRYTRLLAERGHAVS